MSYDAKALTEDYGKHEEAEYTGEIVAVRDTTAAEIYGDEAREPDRAMIEVEVSVNLESGDDTFTDTFSLPKSALSWENPNFKLKQFMDRYKQAPEEGLEVDIGFSEDGYMRIDL